jgi:hypothetical protein
MTPEGSPRLSLEGLTVRVAPREPGSERAPLVCVRLSKAGYPAEGLDPFSPLRLPEKAEVLLRDIDFALLERAVVHGEVDLAAGMHALPISASRELRVVVAEDTTASIRLELGGPAGSESGASPALVRSFELELSRPLVVHDVLQALLEVQDLFEHDGVAGRVQASLAGGREGGAEGAAAARLLGLMGIVADSADRLGEVHLRRVVATPEFRLRSRAWELRLAFSGHVSMAGRIPVPFEDVVLPAWVLPAPHATLEQLVSGRPFATASVKPRELPVEALLDAARSAVRSLCGSIVLAFEAPRLRLEADAVDRTRVQITLAGPPRATMRGEFRGRMDGEVLELETDELGLGFPAPSLGVAVRARVEDAGPAGAPLLSRLRLHLENRVRAGSFVPRVGVEIETSHPLATGGLTASLEIGPLRVDEGAGGLSLASRCVDLWPMTRRVAFEAEARTPADALAEATGTRLRAGLREGRVSGTLELGAGAVLRLALEGSAQLEGSLERDVAAIPELEIEEGTLAARVESQARFALEADARVRPTNAFTVAVRRAELECTLGCARIALADRSIEVPAGTELAAKVREAALEPSGIGEVAVQVAWDMFGRECLLHAGSRSASLLAGDLRRGEVTVHVSPEGRLRFSGEREGLYGIRYFNTLLNPAADPEHLAELLRSDEALGHVFSALELLSPELAQRAELVRDIAFGVRAIARRLGIEQPRHFIPRPAMARFLSVLLAGDECEAGRIADQIRAVTEARGLDPIAVKNIVRPYLDPFDADYEVAAVVRWLEALFRPIEPPAEEAASEQVPLALQSGFEADLRALPSAAEIYERVESGEDPVGFAAVLCRVAPLLTERQLAWIVARAPPDWGAERVRWLGYVHAVKRRVGRIAEAYGGVEYALQGLVIATFVGEAVANGQDPTQLDGEAFGGSRDWPPACALGPAEVATLLEAGLALDRQDRQTQINNRMLLELLVRRPGDFMMQVLAEVGQDNPNALAGVLFAFLEQEQDHMREPMDLPALVERKLGLAVPRRRDFMAGGRRAADSYFEALGTLADAVIARADRHLARKSHLQQCRHRTARAWRSRPEHAEIIASARSAVRLADEAGRDWLAAGARGKRAKGRAAARYRAAFERCAELLAADRTAFQSGWLKAFWARNEEALKVLGVVRNHQQDVDRVRFWLEVRSGREAFDDEQDLLVAVVRALYWDERDRAKLLRDPLVRLLLDPEPGLYDFSVVSCMGVITEGEQGHELQDAFARLERQRGVRVFRAPTGTAMSLEDNARRIIAAFRQVRTPFGYVGYSQGCANALAAESLLRGGTPDEQRVLDRLVCRNLLYSALNGSAHGTFGSVKFQRAMIEGEKLLKHYQVRFSSEVVAAFLRVAKAVADSALFVRVLAGVHSLTPARARDLHREMQIVEHAPTSTTRGVAAPEGLAETLELTYHLLARMRPGEEQDSQVTAEDARGRSTRVVNDMMRLLERCDMPSMRQATHHWAPLTKETELVRTERDERTAAYDSPKDRHVMPWVEVNARFGLIGRRA